MTTHKLPLIELGYQVFTRDGGEEVGAVRDVVPGGRPEIVVYVENTGDLVVPLSAVTAVHSQKVIVDVDKLDERTRVAIGRAHDAEKKGV
jgi:ribosomal 30S subunit maturation factor RimM